MDDFNLLNILSISWKWKKHIIIACVTALVLTFTITHPQLGIIKPKYESVTTILPSNPSLTDRPYLFKTASSGDVSYELFGGKEDIDRILSIAKSTQIINYIVFKFDLLKHYDIDTTEEYFLSRVMSKFKKNYEVAKNEYSGIEIHVIDKNKNTAAEMANEIAAKIDGILKSMVLENRAIIRDIFKEKLYNKKEEVTLLTDTLTMMRTKYRVYNIEAQSEVLTTEITETEAELGASQAEKEVLRKKLSSNNIEVILLNAKIKGLEKKLNNLTSENSGNEFNLKSFTQGSDKVRVLQSRLGAATEEMRVLNIAHQQYTVATNPDISAIYIMEKAYPSEKAVPIQLISSIIALLLTLFISLITVTILERSK